LALSESVAANQEQGIIPRIVLVRGCKVLLDRDLAELYVVSTKVLLQAVKRNAARFPPDFMFALKEQEVTNLRSQIVTSSSAARNWGGRRYRPYAFTEQGVAMLSSVLRSARAVAVNIAIMRAFVHLREMAGANAELAKKLDELEHRVSGHDHAITGIVRAIRELAAPTEAKPKRRIGFITSD
jgi:ORF6N domain